MPLPPPPLPPPPQPIADTITVRATKAMIALLRRRARVSSRTTEMPITKTTAICRDPGHGLGVRRFAKDAWELGAVVVTVRVTGTLVVEEANVTVAGLKLQLLLGGKFEHIVGERVAEPVKPF